MVVCFLNYLWDRVEVVTDFQWHKPFRGDLVPALRTISFRMLLNLMIGSVEDQSAEEIAIAFDANVRYLNIPKSRQSSPEKLSFAFISPALSCISVLNCRRDFL